MRTSNPMNISAYELALINGGFVIIGAFIGALFTYLFAISLSNKKGRSVAAADLRAAFSPVLSQMALAQENPDIRKKDILEGTLQAISLAIEKYRPYVPDHQKEKYQKAWEEYYSTGFNKSIHLAKYSVAIETNEGKRDPYKLFIKNVDNILLFAKM